MLRNSIRARLIACVLLVQVALAIGVVSTGVYYTRRRLHSSLDAALQARAMRVAALVRYAEDDNTKLIFDNSLIPPPFDRRFPDLFEIRKTDGELLTHSAGWSSDVLAENPGHRTSWRFSVGKIPYRAVRLQGVPVLDREKDSPDPGSLTVFYAVPVVQMDAEVWQTGVFLGSVSLVLTLVTAIIGWWAIRRSLIPLDQLATSASEINAKNWDFRVPERTTTPDELLPLVSAMEAMIEKLEEAFRQQREFVANAAHEMKTPVAIVKSSLQSLQQRQRTSEEYRVGVEESLEDLGRLERLMQQLLRLARAEQWSAGAVERELEPVDVVETCQQAVARFRSIAKERDIVLELVASSSDAFVKADPDDLEIVWANLLENAIHYSSEHSKISMLVEASELGCRVVVEDHGVGIPEDQMAHVFERFHRGDPSRARNTGGFGLGLAISRALVEAYRGRISAQSVPGKGTRMIVELPVETEVPDAKSLSLN